MADMFMCPKIKILILFIMNMFKILAYLYK
jgi:hypothetical protein